MACKTCGSKVRTGTKTNTTIRKATNTSSDTGSQTFYYAGKIYEVKR
jgi:hypothetical protein